VHDASEKTEFCIGAAAYPDFPQPEERIQFFKLKVDAGAEYGITDMLFDPESYARFHDHCAKEKVFVPILPGTRLLKTQSQALRMASKFKATIPKTTLDRLPSGDGPDAVARGLDLFMELSERLKQLGAPGVHLYVISDTEGASSALKLLADCTKQGKE
jgi:methylenetetrahydrofolate reductase (NADPH)